MTKILIVEDEASFSEALEFLLGKEGFSVVTAPNGKEAMAKFDQGGIDLVLLDLMIPEVSGIDVCKYIRSKAATPIIMLTAKDSEIDKVVGLELGADDYVTKPFHIEEILARLRALVRRATGHASSDLVCGPIRVDTRAGRVLVNGEPIRLTSHEYRLLAYMMHHMGRIVSRSELVEHLYDQDFDRDSNTVEVFIGRLRKKLGVDVIETVRGLGYRLDPDATP